MNVSRTGVRVESMLDVVYLDDREVAEGRGLAAKINAVTNPARRLEFFLTGSIPKVHQLG